MGRLAAAAIALAALLVGALLVVITAITGVQVSAAPCQPAATQGGINPVAITVGGLTADQIRNAGIILAVGQQTPGIGPAGETVALAAALVESRLLNVPYGDRDSLGLFQMRPSQGWGTPTQIMDPVYAVGRFYQTLTALPGWQRMAPGDAAQAVERSAFPARYAVQVPLAAQLVSGAIPGAPAPLQLTGNCIPQGSRTPASGTVGPGYINPITPGLWGPSRTDQGVDWIPFRPAPVLAVGDGTVIYSTTTSGWPGGGFIVYRLASGSHAGLNVFAAEHLTNLMPVGAQIHAGDTIAVGLPGSPWTEWGWAAGPCSCPATPYNGAADGTPMPGGKAFARFLIELGVPADAPSPWQNPGPGPDRP